jgi:hypothetical protein
MTQDGRNSHYGASNGEKQALVPEHVPRRATIPAEI